MALNDNNRDNGTGGNGGATGSPNGNSSTPPGAVITPGFRAAVNALYQKYYKRDATEAELQGHVGNPGGINAIEDALKASVPAGTTDPNPNPNPNPNPGPGAPNPNFIFNEKFTPPSMLGLPGLPSFTGANAAPGFPTIPNFQAPTASEALNDPGYAFRLGQGRDLLENSASAKGTLNDSSTAKAILDYGQNAASQEYGNVWNRDYNVYQNDVTNKFLLPYAAQYKTWSDSVLGPQMEGFRTSAAWNQHANDVNQTSAWDRYLQDFNIFKDRRDTAIDVATR